MIFEALEKRVSPASQIAEIKKLPIPARGWNTRDRYGFGSSRQVLQYAPILKNWMLVDGSMIIRPGYDEWATGLTANKTVQSLMEYSGPSAAAKMFAGCDTKIFDVTASGAVGAASVSSLTNGLWQHTMFATTSGNYLVCVNGADGVRTYDGSAWASQTLTVVTAANLIHVNAHLGRLWFVEKNTLKAWYLAPYAIAGAATKFDLGPLCRKGGYLMAIGSWTASSGESADDLIVFYTSEGEALVYSGVDPNSVSTFSQVGSFRTGKPIGRRCMTKFGADLALLTQSGIVLMSDLLNADQTDDSSNDNPNIISDVIRDEFINAYRNNGTSNTAWELTLYPERGWLIVNIPQLTTNKYNQFVYNPLMGAWFPFEDLPAICWGTSAGGIYFGGTSTVYRWDNFIVDDNGSAVNTDIGFSWWNYDIGNTKRFSVGRPNLFTDGTVAPLINMRTEYDERQATDATEPALAPAGTAWDAGDWDNTDWGGAMVPSLHWITLEGEGIVGAPRMSLSTLSASVKLTSFDVAYFPGGVL